ncbi:MAG: hypothetical protein ACFFDN_06865 [Candidatus Hodarchaeota archaeon]
MNTNKLNYLIVVIIFIFLLAGIFSYMMIEPHWYDENMYISAGVLIQNYSLYKDFAFLQMPYLPFIYGIIYKLTGTTYYLLTAELINFFFMIISCLLILLISYKLTENLFISLGSMLLFILNQIVIYIMGYSANTILPIAFSLLGFYLYIISVSTISVKRLGIFFSGMAIALAIGTKLYYAALIPPFFIISLLYPKSLAFKKRIIKNLIPLSIGVLIGLLPVFYYFITDAAIFLFNNFDYHILNTVYRELEGHTMTMSLISKIHYGKRILRYPSNISLLIGILFLFMTLSTEKQNIKNNLLRFIQMENLLLVLIILLTIIAAFTPTPLWLHYFALPFPYVIILLSSWYRHLETLNKKLTNLMILCLIIASFLSSGEKLFDRLNQTFYANQWTSLKVHQIAKEIKSYIGKIDKNQKIATLYPLYALEGGLPIYKELSTGHFIFRLGELIPEDIVYKYCYVSSPNIYELLEKDPPKAILVETGKDDSYKDFIKFAEEKNYEKIQKDFDRMILYINSEK